MTPTGSQRESAQPLMENATVEEMRNASETKLWTISRMEEAYLYVQYIVLL